MPRITDNFTSDIRKPSKGQIIYRDDDLIGFGLRVTASQKAFIAECKVNGTARRVTLGRYEAISADDARLQAEKLIDKMTAKRLPSRRSVHAPTLRELLALYLERKTLRPATVATYSSVINNCLPDWLDKPITAITEDMVQTRHRDLVRPNHQGTTGQFQANQCMRALSQLFNFAADNLTGVDGGSIIDANPVQKLNKNKLWYKTNRRELVVPDHKIAAWYQAVMTLESTVVRDYLLLLILTGLRRTEAITLKWSDINFEDQTLTIPPEICSVSARVGIGHHLIRKLVNHTQVLDVAHKYILIGVEGLREPMQQITDQFVSLMGCSSSDWSGQVNGPKLTRRSAQAPTLDAVLDQYIKTKLLRTGAVKHYENAIWTGLRDWVHLPVTVITPEMVLAKHRELSKTRKTSYANMPFQILRLLLNFAAETYLTPAGRPIIEANPTRQLVLAKVFKKSPIKDTVIPAEKMADWYQAVISELDPSARDVLLFAAFTGTTRMQVLTLKWDDVDFDKQTIRIRAEVCQNHRGYELPLPEFLDLLLRKRKSIVGSSNFVFPGRSGGHKVSTQRATKRVGEKIGHNFEMNDLRRGFVAAASASGIGQQLIKRLTNHSGSSDMTDVFFQPTDDDLRAAMEKISSHLIDLMNLDLKDWNTEERAEAIN